MSSGEEFEVDVILEQRKRKGVVEYLVRWQGFNDLYDSWEPASGIAHCKNAIKDFLTKKKQSRSKSRSRSKGRQTKSRSRSGSRGRQTKSEKKSTRSRSRSSGRKSTKSSSKTTKEVAVTKESSPVEQERPSRLRSRQKTEEKASTSKTEVAEEEEAKEEKTKVVETTKVVKTSVETMKSTPVRTTETTTMTTRSRMAVRQVENDQKPPAKESATVTEEKETWLWWFADHAVLILFIIVSLIALSFTIEGVSGVRDKLVPDLGVLRQRLTECYDHFAQGLTAIVNTNVENFNALKDAVFGSGDGAKPAQPQASAAPKTSA